MNVSFILPEGVRVQGKDDFPKVLLGTLNCWVAGEFWNATSKAVIDKHKLVETSF